MNIGPSILRLSSPPDARTLGAAVVLLLPTPVSVVSVAVVEVVHLGDWLFPPGRGRHVEPLESRGRRRPYRLTPPGAQVVRARLAELENTVTVGMERQAQGND